MIGKLINGRYEILELLGQGGMASVYRARDLNLEREVAVKALHENISSDPEFRERFRREARAASALGSPNIVQVYDFVDSEQGTFIVMELVRGEDLRSVLERSGRLSLDRAISITLDILNALRVAHEHGLVHRDISARNVLVGQDGSIKVSDFGIARVLGERTLTQAGDIIGSVQYISPEQARGEEAEFRSDIYAVGVLLYQMLTGVLPFNADNAVKLALKHIQEQPNPPSRLRPEISGALDDIVMCALAKDPEERFASTIAFSDALNNLRYGPAEDSYSEDYEEDEFATMVRPANWNDSGENYEDSYNGEILSDGDSDSEVRSGESKKKSRVGLVVGLMVTVFLAVVGGITWALVYSVPRAAVPNVQNETIAIATQTLEAAGFKVNIEEQKAVEGVPEGVVVGQTPEAGTSLATGSVVYLVVSRGKDSVFLPDFSGLPLEKAVKELERLGLTANVVPSDEAGKEPNTIIKQDPPAGSKVARGAAVTLSVSSSEGSFEVPKLVGMTLDDATEAVSKIGGVVVISEVDAPSDVAPNTVISQDPEPGTKIERGSKVRISVSRSGSSTAIMPDLVGKTVREAQAEARALGLNLTIEGSDSSYSKVVSQRPAAGAKVADGSASVFCTSMAVVPSLDGMIYESAVAHLERVGLHVGSVSKSSSGETPGVVLQQNPAAGIEVNYGSSVDLVISAAAPAPAPEPEPEPEPAPAPEAPTAPVHSAPAAPVHSAPAAPAPSAPAPQPALPASDAPPTPALDLPGDLPI